MPTNTQAAQLAAAIAALEAQRPILGDAVVDAGLGPMREKLAEIEAAPVHANQQRKQVTVLFADAVGFTALSETLDAELVTGVMNRVWEALDTVILDYGGRIDKHLGDAVMALWGVDAAREDDAERAIRAALALQATCVEGALPARVAMRVGLSTGPVMLGEVGTTHEFTAMGDAVNVASRLQSFAPEGGVVISHDTYRHVRGVFDVQALEPVALKGKAEPVQTYEVLRAKPHAFRLKTRGVEGIETRMVGRDAELRVLEEAFRAAAQGGEARLVAVVGDAGVGKSRLLYEFDNHLELLPEEIAYFKGRAIPALQNVPYSLFRDLLAYRCDIRDSDRTDVVLQKLHAGLVHGRPQNSLPMAASPGDAEKLTTDQAEVLAHWLGFDFSRTQAVSRLLDNPEFATVAKSHLIRYLRLVASERPTVIFLEDIHWADDSSLELIDYLHESLSQARVLIVCMARPSIDSRRAQWHAGMSTFNRIDLKPLSAAASHALVVDILQRVDEIPPGLRDTIVDAAEGNPFYTEEIIKMFIDQGLIVREGDGGTEQWRVRRDILAQATVPPTLTSLLQARLDRLPLWERDLLQRAAVVGRYFWDGVVAELAQKKRAEIQTGLKAAQARELIFKQKQSAFAGSDEFVFKHNLLRDVAYERVLLRWREELHGRVARWLEVNAGERQNEYLSLIALHYQLAGEHDRAATYLLRAGKEALRANAYASARRSFEEVLSLIGEEPENDLLTSEAAILLGKALYRQGSLEAAEQSLKAGLADAQRIDDRQLQTQALMTLSSMLSSRGDYGGSRAMVADSVLPLCHEIGGSVLAEALLKLAVSDWRLGDLEAASEHGDQALSEARRAGDVTQEAKVISLRANIAADLGELDLAIERHEEGLAFARANGDLVQEATALLNLGSVYQMMGEYSAARSYGSQALQKLRDLGFRRLEVIALGNLAQADLKLGDLEVARSEIRDALRLSSERAIPFVLFAVMVWAEILAADNEQAQALALLSFVRGHEATDFQVRQEITDKLERWATDQTDLDRARTAAAKLNLEEIVADILSEAEDCD